MKNTSTMNISFSINQGHLFFAFVTINSILTHNHNSFFNIYIIQDNSIKEEDTNKYINALYKSGKNNFKIELIDVTKHPSFQRINHGVWHWGKEIFYKVLLASLLPKLERILHLDTDVVVKGDITNIYNTNLENYYFAGDKFKNGVICVGVLLYNLVEIRKNNVENTWLNSIKNDVVEERAINQCFANKMKVLSNVYTLSGSRKTIFNAEFSKISILHIISRKPWWMSPFRKYGIRTTLIWYKSIAPFVKPNYKPVFYLIKFYGVFITMFLYAFTKPTPLDKKVYKSAYYLLKKVII